MTSAFAISRADRGDFDGARALIRSNYRNSQDVQSVIGWDAALEEDANMQLINSRNMNNDDYSGRTRKEMKTSSFQLFNQQKMK